MIDIYTYELNGQPNLIENRIRNAMSKRHSVLDLQSAKKHLYLNSEGKSFLGNESDNKLYGTRLRGMPLNLMPKLIFKLSKEFEYKQIKIRLSILSFLIVVMLTGMILHSVYSYIQDTVLIFDYKVISILLLAYIMLIILEINITKKLIFKVVNDK
ncbi:hypothetical protein [Putridiphycobacter roseus]|nr:hypothetical protein [Putridiphycobacter roseus]